MIRAQSSIQRLIFSWWIQFLIHCWSSIHWLKPSRIHSQVITYLHPFSGVSMQPKYIFGKHCKVCEKMSLLEAFLSHHYRFLVERQVQQDSREEQKAGRAISAKLESIENLTPECCWPRDRQRLKGLDFPGVFLSTVTVGFPSSRWWEKVSLMPPSPPQNIAVIHFSGCWKRW